MKRVVLIMFNGLGTLLHSFNKLIFYFTFLYERGVHKTLSKGWEITDDPVYHS